MDWISFLPVNHQYANTEGNTALTWYWTSGIRPSSFIWAWDWHKQQGTAHTLGVSFCFVL